MWYVGDAVQSSFNFAPTNQHYASSAVQAHLMSARIRGYGSSAGGGVPWLALTCSFLECLAFLPYFRDAFIFDELMRQSINILLCLLKINTYPVRSHSGLWFSWWPWCVGTGTYLVVLVILSCPLIFLRRTHFPFTFAPINHHSTSFFMEVSCCSCHHATHSEIC